MPHSCPLVPAYSGLPDWGEEPVQSAPSQDNMTDEQYAKLLQQQFNQEEGSGVSSLQDSDEAIARKLQASVVT